jgi:FKBP-type peptidyl-prolyl cis-trans isomerase FkpA
MKRVLLFLLVSLMSLHCKKDDDQNQSQTEIDNEIILKYIADNELDAMNVGSGLYYVNEETGTGENPDPSSTVRVAYRGYFTNGEVFDQSNEAGISFGLNQVIQGWRMAIPFFKEGGRGKLLIPSELAYGSSPRSGIPANSVLIFDIHLIEVL